jgi:hypothetical protein
MSIQANFPAISPTLNLSFALTKALDPRITFSRASTGTFYGTQTAKAEENLNLNSQTFDAVTWAPLALSVTANTTAAPDGTTTADTITEDSTLSTHRISFAGFGFSASGVVTLSVFAKLGSGSRFFTIGVNNSPDNWATATFNLSTGANTQTQAAGSYSAPSATITAVANGFYRCTLTVTTNTAISTLFGLNNTDLPAATQRGFGATYTGDGTSSLILWGAQLEQRSAVTAYTATTTQPITNYVPQLQTAASGVARFDHNPITDESLGLLIEEQRTNLQISSENVDGANWAKSAIISQLNIAIAPDGNQTADKIIPSTANSAHHVESGTTVVAGTQYTASVYLKAAEETVAVLWNNTVGAVATFNLSTGTVTSGTGVITPVGNGWYRCSILYTPSGTIGQIRYYPRQSTAFAGNDFNGIYIWGAQLEVGAFPTSYIQTVASQVTRAADAASMTGANFSSWYNQAEGTFYLDADMYETQSTFFRYLLSANTGSGVVSDLVGFLVPSNGNNVRGAVSVGGTFTASLNSPITLGAAFKGAFAYKTDDFAASFNGGASLTDTSGVLPQGVNRLYIGGFSDAGPGGSSSTHIRKVAYYPLRIQNNQLQALTS